MSDSGQKFVGRNRAPRVQIEYDVEAYGSEKKVELPFVMGVISDLSGRNNANLPPVDERKFVDIDIDNFDERMKAFEPKAKFHVENKISEEGGKMEVSLTFKSMDDFSPDAVAEQIEPLKKLLDVRQQLNNLLTYMDGKANAEELLRQALNDNALLKSLMSAPKPDEAPETGENKEEPDND